jgi:hypothetical protein|nr:MAG TPA: hypothetical protein [Caudoviricetes sp.]
MAVLTEAMENSFDNKIAIGEYGTQLFWWNKDAMKFEYALPLVSGGEYGGDTETFEAPELDLDYVAKITGRTTLNDITFTSNYTKDRYIRWLQILSNIETNVYMEVFSDGSATVIAGTSGRPTIQGGDVRQIEVTVAPENMIWVNDIGNVTNPTDDDDTIGELNSLFKYVTPAEKTFTDLTSGDALPIDYSTVPSKRDWAYQGEKTVGE